MNEKYKVTQEFMDALVEWVGTMPSEYVSRASVVNLPNEVIEWWLSKDNDLFETNRRLIAIIQWANGKDVFVVEKPHKFVVRSKKPDPVGDYWFVRVDKGLTGTTYYPERATKFETRDEAESWANSHQEVVEIDEDGNEVTN